jgi:hypothetical protein
MYRVIGALMALEDYLAMAILVANRTAHDIH